MNRQVTTEERSTRAKGGERREDARPKPGNSARLPLTPTDEDFDHMHHALGRPAGSWVEPYRNYFVCAADGPDAERFAVLGSYWLRAGVMNGGRDAVYHVTPHGQRQVMAWLEERNQKAGRRAWRVYGGGLTDRMIVARSASAAKYTVWLEVSDIWPDSFGDFLSRGVRARAA